MNRKIPIDPTPQNIARVRQIVHLNQKLEQATRGEYVVGIDARVDVIKPVADKLTP